MMCQKNEEINNKNSKDETSLQIADEDEDFIQRRVNRLESESKEKKNVLNTVREPSIKKINSTHLNNLLLSCVKNEEYCYTMLDYMKKMFHFSQVDYYLAYTQILYCFKPKEM